MPKSVIGLVTLETRERERERERGRESESERKRGERETAGYEPFDLD
jgi:hypothetical protein